VFFFSLLITKKVTPARKKHIPIRLPVFIGITLKVESTKTTMAMICMIALNIERPDIFYSPLY